MAKATRATRRREAEPAPVVEVPVEEDLLVGHEDVGHGVEAQDGAEACPGTSP